jgi:hypothetical protein
MSHRPVRRICAAFLAFVLLSAGDCGGLSFSDIVTGHSATISVKNNSAEAVTVLLYADDASNTGAVNPHGSPSITTHVDGFYTVIVAGQGEKVTNWNSTLRFLRTSTEDFYKALNSGSQANANDSSQSILHAKTALGDLHKATVTLASCTGTITFPDIGPSPRPIELEATFTKSADGHWSASCPSNS